MVARFQSVLRQFAPDAGRLHGNDGGKPGKQDADREKRHHEKSQNRLGSPQSMVGHFCNQGIEEIGENDSDRDRDQDRLNKPDYIGRDPDKRASYCYKHYDEERRKRGPHCLALPGGRISHPIKRRASVA